MKKFGLRTPWPMVGWSSISIPLPAPPPYPCKVSLTVYLCTCLFGSGGSFSVAIASTIQMSNHLLFEVRLVYKSIHARVASYVACKHFIAPAKGQALCGVCAALIGTAILFSSNRYFKKSLQNRAQ